MTETLEQLEQRIRALEEGQAADQLQPGTFYLNTKGELEEKLSGKLTTTGIIFPDAKKEENDSIVWAALPNGAYLSGSAGSLEGGAENEGSFASLNRECDGTEASVKAVARTETIGGVTLIIDAEGHSNFVQWSGAVSSKRLLAGTYEGAPGTLGEHTITIETFTSGLLQAFATPRPVGVGANYVQLIGVSFHDAAKGEINVDYSVLKSGPTSVRIDWLTISTE